MARKAGAQAVELAKRGLTARDIVTRESFENAIIVHAAISGSTNAILHLPAIAHEFGIEIDADTFERIHKSAHYLLDVRPAGRWPSEYVYYAGGVPAIMEEVRHLLHLDVMTVTGKTLGENLDGLKVGGYYEKCAEYLKKTGVKKEDIIRPFDAPIGDKGTIAILRGNLSSEAVGEAGLNPVIGWMPRLVEPKQGEFYLVGGKQGIHSHTMTQNVATMNAISREYGLERAWISAQDAADLGIADGDMIEIASSEHTGQVAARVTQRMRPGVVFLPTHYGGSSPYQSRAYEFGLNMTDFVPFHMEPGTGATMSQEVAVTVRKVEA